MTKDDRTGQLDEQRPELGDQLAERGRQDPVRILPGARAPVAVFEVLPLDGELAELQASRQRAPRRPASSYFRLIEFPTPRRPPGGGGRERPRRR